MTTQTILVDYNNSSQTQDLIALLDAYAQDPMGGAEPLSAYTKKNLIAALQSQPQVFSVMCYIDDKPAGLVNCVRGFSTFKAKPLVNIHDVVVSTEYRGQGISRLMLQEVERIARDEGCCKLTLEVLEGNKVAQQAYLNFGFTGYELDPEMGKALFWEKPLKY